MEKNYIRRFSLEEDFMNFSVDDILYGYLQYLATVNPNYVNVNQYGDLWYGRLYLTQKKITENKELIFKNCGFNNRATYNNHMKKLKERKLIEDGTIEINGEKVPCIYFPHELKGRYQFVNNGVLRILLNAYSKSSIQVYVYLLNKWYYKNCGDYEFTIGEIAIALGYTEQSAHKNVNVRQSIIDVLEALKSRGIINYVDIYKELPQQNGAKNIITPVKVLKFVAEKEEDLPTV